MTRISIGVSVDTLINCSCERVFFSGMRIFWVTNKSKERTKKLSACYGNVNKSREEKTVSMLSKCEHPSTISTTQPFGIIQQHCVRLAPLTHRTMRTRAQSHTPRTSTQEKVRTSYAHTHPPTRQYFTRPSAGIRRAALLAHRVMPESTTHEFKHIFSTLAAVSPGLPRMCGCGKMRGS